MGLPSAAVCVVNEKTVHLAQARLSRVKPEHRHLKLTFFSDDYIVLKLRYLHSMKTNVDKNYINNKYQFLLIHR